MVQRFEVHTIDLRAELIDNCMVGRMSGKAQLQFHGDEVVPRLGERVELAWRDQVFEAFVTSIQGRECYSTVVRLDVVREVEV